MKERDFGAEIDGLVRQVEEIQSMLQRMEKDTANVIRDTASRSESSIPLKEQLSSDRVDGNKDGGRKSRDLENGAVYYSGIYRGEQGSFRWEPQEREVERLLQLDSEKAAKVLAALGHKQRLDILLAVAKHPVTGAELVERLNMGTTGQLYHHIKALLGADLLVQEERGGRYSIPGHRTLPLLLLLAAVSDLLDASDYLDMSDARSNAGAYLGAARGGYDQHLLLWAVLENSILEHQSGNCSEVGIYLHKDGSITVSDNGRGIPVRALPQSGKPMVQAVLTDMKRLQDAGSSYTAPGGEKGISIAIVNALSRRLTVEIRRDGSIFRQDYRHGVPQTGLLTVGNTCETGTSVTFEPDNELFAGGFDQGIAEKRVAEVMAAYPELTIRVHGGNEKMEK